MSIQSKSSKVSQMTQKVFDDITQISKNNNVINVINIIDNDTLISIWNSLGVYIQKQLRTGRAVSIPKFGIFTFSAPTFNMKGTTNSGQRETEVREPIFLVSKEFAKGKTLVPSVYREMGLTPAVQTQGIIQQQICNWSDIAKIHKSDINTVKLGVQRVIRQLDEYCRNHKGQVAMEIPQVGILYIRKKFIAVHFNDFLQTQSIGLLKIPILERKDRVQSNLTKQMLQNLVQKQENDDQKYGYQELEAEAQNWLQDNLSIDVNKNRILSPQASLIPSRTRSQVDLQINKIDLNEIIRDKKVKIDNQSDTHSVISGVSSNLLFDSISQRGQGQHQKKSSQFKITRHKGSFSMENIIIKKFQHLLRQKCLKAEDAYAQIVTIIYGINATRKSRINVQQFLTALQKLGYDIYEDEAECLFKQLDSNNDKYVDLEEFLKVLNLENNPDKFIQDVMNKNQLTIEDMLKTLGLKQSDQHITHSKLVTAFKRLPYIYDNEAKKISQHILGDKSLISAQDLMNYLASKTWNVIDQITKSDPEIIQNSTMFDVDWLKTTLSKINSQLKDHPNDRFLLDQFSYFDNKESGSLDFGNFKTVFLNNKDFFKLNLEDLDRLVRYLPKDKNGNIDYYAFLKKVKNSELPDTHNNIDFVSKFINKYLDDNNITAISFIHFLISEKEDRKKYNIENHDKLKFNVFGELAAKKIFPKKYRHLILQVAQYIDINKDTFVDKYDLETFLSRSQYLEDKKDEVIMNSGNTSVISQNIPKIISLKQQLDQQKLQKSLSNSSNIDYSSFEKENKLKQQKQQALFPVTTLPDNQLAKIRRELKNALFFQNVSLIQAYRIMDLDGDGFVSISEWNEVVDRWLKLSVPAKEGLFAYLDHLRIGMFDYPRWYDVMKRFVLEKGSTTKDGFEWQEFIFQKIHNWFYENNLTSEEAFRLMDTDFDGFVSKDDLIKFLNQTLKINIEELNIQRIDRLFKLIDTYKRGYIQKQDINKIFTAENQLFDNFASSTMNSHENSQQFQKDSIISRRSKQFSQSFHNSKSSQMLSSQGEEQKQQQFDWFYNACQQLALKLTKKYKTLSDSFNAISRFEEKVRFTNFKQFIEDENVLEGFNLTHHLFQKMFAYIDPHKKGYLTESDWLLAFSKFIKSEELPFHDIKDNLKFNFNNNIQAYKYFVYPQDKSQENPWSNIKKEKFNQKKQIQDNQLENSQNSHINNLPDLSFQCFFLAIKSLFQQVYSIAQIKQIWLQILEKNGIEIKKQEDAFNKYKINFQQFMTIFGSNRNNETHNSSLQNTTSQQFSNSHFFNSSMQSAHNTQSLQQTGSQKSFNIRSNSESRYKINSSHLKLSKMNQFFPQQPTTQISGEFVLDRFKNMALSSGKDLYKIFQQEDKQNTSYVTTIQFKNILWKLNLGLNSQDVALIVKFADIENKGQVFINWKEFLKKLKYSNNEVSLLQRSQQRIQLLKKDIYQYMITPKDAFRSFDLKKTGLLNFTDFQKMVQTLCNLSKKDLPSFSVLKDLFEFIDIKKDGVLDIDEFQQVFLTYDDKKQNISKQINNFSEKRENQNIQQHNGLYNTFSNSNTSLKQQRLLIDDVTPDFRFLKSPEQIKQIRKQKLKSISATSQHFYKYDTEWERSKEYDAIIQMIGKNKQILYEEFKKCVEQKLGHKKNISEEESKYLSHEKIKQILKKLFEKHQINIGENNWKIVIGFAENKGKIDFKFMLDVYKQRLDQMQKPPDYQDLKNDLIE